MSYEEVNRLICKEPLESKYEVGAELGRGKFAIVKRVVDKSSGEKYAAKFLRKRRGGKLCRDDIIVEMDIMRQSMDHHRIIKLREVFESTREMILILELATGGELFRMIAVDPLPEDRARDVVLQLLEGVEHLHSLNIVHLDLKPENILLYRKGQLDIRIADFGLALQITPGEQVKTLVGTAEYVAPEILNYEPLSTAADMW
jgi:serine/threonine protein kinase